jgi:hypothetical protein
MATKVIEFKEIELDLERESDRIIWDWMHGTINSGQALTTLVELGEDEQAMKDMMWMISLGYPGPIGCAGSA